MFREPCAHHQEVKFALHSLCYHDTGTSERSKITKIHLYKYERTVVITPEKFTYKFYYFVLIFIEMYFGNFR